MTAPVGLLDRIGGALFQAPPQLDGLITPEDIQNAQRQGLLQLGTGLLAQSGPTTTPVRFGQALGTALQGAQKGYQGALDSVIGRRSDAAQYGQLKLKNEQAQKAAEGRQAILAKYPQPDGKDPDALRQWIDQTLPLWLAVDPQTASQLAEVRKSIQPKTPATHPVGQVDLGDRVQIIDPTSGAVLREEKKTASPSTLLRFGEMTPAAQQTVITSALTAFDRETKDYTKAAEAWSQVDHVLQRALSGAHSPDDIVQLIDGISRLNNPGAVVRVGTVALQLKKIGSLGDKLRMFAASKFQGKWPTDIIQGIASAAREIAREHEKAYNDIRKRAIFRAEKAGIPYMDGVLPNVWALTSPDGASDGRPSLSSIFGGME